MRTKMQIVLLIALTLLTGCRNISEVSGTTTATPPETQVSSTEAETTINLAGIQAERIQSDHPVSQLFLDALYTVGFDLNMDVKKCEKI